MDRADETLEKSSADKPKQPATYANRIEFLTKVIEATDRRRDSVENKSGILVASNAILLTAIIGFGIPSITRGSSSILLWLRVVLMIGALGGTIASLLFSTWILHPLRTQKQRSRIMDLSESEFNVYAFIKFAEYDKADYFKMLESLTDQQIFEQLAANVHNVSRILRNRYIALERANLLLVVSAIMLATLMVINLLG